MRKIIVFVDDAAYAREHLQTLALRAAGPAPVHWVLVSCAPRMTQRVGKWMSHRARENWRAKWLARANDDIAPLLARHAGSQVTLLLASGPLTEMTRQLRLAHGAETRVLDARRPRAGADPELPGQKPSFPGKGAVTGLLVALASLASLLALAIDMGDA